MPINPHAPTRPETPISGLSLATDNQSSVLSDPPFSAKQPEAYLKHLATNDERLSHRAKNQLVSLIDQLEGNTGMSLDKATRLAATFISENATEPTAVENLFKYLNCRFMIEHRTSDNPETGLQLSKAALHRSIPNQLPGQTEPLSKSARNLFKEPSKIGPVITCHPTQLSLPESVACLTSYNSDFRTERDAKQFATSLWQVAGRRTEKPTVLAEAKAAMPSVANILGSIRSSTKIIMGNNNEAQGKPVQEPVLEAGNWIAGDRDGNPTITPQLLGDVMALWSQMAFNEYANKLSADNADSKPHCLHNLFTQAGKVEELQNLKTRLHHTMLHIVNKAGANETSQRFESPAELVSQINSLRDTLNWETLSSDEKTMVTQKLDQLSIFAKSFGFHGVSTHIRQNSEVNQKTVAAIVNAVKPGTPYTDLNETDKVSLLTSILNNDPTLKLPMKVTSDQPDVQKELDFLNSYKGLRSRFGDAALPTIITANTETLSDMLEVCVMLKYARLGMDGDLGMNVMPLIETVPDMKNAEDLLQSLLNNSTYKKHLGHHDNVQHVMLGYSDSMRGHGIVAAAWEGHKLPATLLKVAEEGGVKTHFFHGRGGTEARGARESYTDEIGHVDGRSLDVGYTQTEQGEELFKKYGDKNTAKLNMNNLINAAVNTNTQSDEQRLALHGETMDLLAKYSTEAYLDLYQDPQLAEFLQTTTPLPHVGATNAGSRPASRISNLTGQAFLNKLRAIPYVAAWYQSSSMAPAYYGLGKGLEQLIEKGPGSAKSKINELQTMYKEWPFFKNMIDRAETAMKKADMNIAQQYAKLNPTTLPVFNKVMNEFELSRRMIDQVKQQNTATHQPQSSGLRTFAHAAQIGLMKSFQTTQDKAKLATTEDMIAMSMQAIASSIGRFG